MRVRGFAVVHYHEIGLKGRNRSFFEQALVRNLARATGDLGLARPRRLPGRIIIELPEGADRAAVEARLRDVYGAANFSIASGGTLDLESVYEVAWELVRERSFETFAVRARRTQSPFPFSAREINEKLGTVLLERSGKRVNLSAPDLTCHVEIVGDLVFVYAGRTPGAGGLPVGVSGTVVALLSAGIDSPVAAARMMRRGARCVFVHFHSQPFTDASSVRRAGEIAGMLARFQHDVRLFLVPLAPAQQRIVAACPESLRTLLYRRMMVRIASEIAGREGAKALVTGDSLGQVASQTLENLWVVEDAASLPVHRPNLGRDKAEIIAEAQALGTFEVSSAPCQEACVLFEPRRPATKASVAQARAAEESLDLTRLVADSVAASETRTYRFPA
ncbi:MAG: tRNA 4-thiouridine(8) synthase ThiI [Acidobacteria bacterium]|nr:tRNA 4-thiouridine(8) synthase ThiI [Acidobacteriota bacterium]